MSLTVLGIKKVLLQYNHVLIWGGFCVLDDKLYPRGSHLAKME